MTKAELWQQARHIWGLIDWKMVGEIVVEGIVISAIMTYMAGRGLGQWMHRTNDRLAALWVRLWVGVPSAPAPSAPPSPLLLPPARTTELLAPAPVIAPAGPTAEELMALTVRQLMELTGTRRKLSKAKLIELAMA